MKKVILISILAFSTVVFSQQQPAKRFKVELTANEWQMILQIIDDSATPGEVRKPLINSIQYQVNAQIKSDTETKKSITDTTKKKP